MLRPIKSDSSPPTEAPPTANPPAETEEKVINLTGSFFPGSFEVNEISRTDPATIAIGVYGRTTP